jgi:hypothetical protein
MAFESLCRDLWEDIWGPGSGAQKNGRSGQPQAGVDVYGRQSGRWIGVQSKQKDGLLRTKISVAELEQEVEKALTFKPPLSSFLLATSGPAEVRVQERAREITDDHATRGLFSVEIWPWERIWSEIYRRKDLLLRIGPEYWPRIYHLAVDHKVNPTRLTRVPEKLFGREEGLASLEAAWQDSKVHLVTLVAWGGVGKTSLVATWAAGLAARGYDGAHYFDWSFYSQGTKEQGGVLWES